jgi:hypothetical protein
MVVIRGFVLACLAGVLQLAFVALGGVYFAAPLEARGKQDQQAPRVQIDAQSPKVKAAAPAASHASVAKPKVIPRREYVGDAACAKCHQDMVDAYNKTAHHVTSEAANKETIVGNFRAGANTMTTADPNLSFRMDVKGDAFFQTAIWGPPSASASDSAAENPSSSPASGTRSRTERLDMVIGSGGKGQTYLYWKDDQLFQLPVGYSTVLQHWINSPGYRDGTASFERPIVPRCLECHAAYFESVFPGTDTNLYDTKNFVLGISCERCHGPGRGHVESYGAKPAARASAQASAHLGAAIVNPAKLAPARRADVCAQCHDGPGKRAILPAFSYVPGQPLEKYIELPPADAASDVDVHGKQGRLMRKSRCYQQSANMDCSTCHEVHKKEPDLAAMSQHCLSCHKVEPSVTHAKVGEGITNNCIDCHMPQLESTVVDLDVDGKKVRPRFRTHWIKIYSEAERQ